MDNSNNKNNGFYWALGLGAAVVFLVFLVNVVNVRFGVPYKKHGPLSVKEDHLVDSEERPVQLKGVCIPGIAWYPQYINKASFRTLRDEWGVDVIRLAVYTQEYDGYLNGADITQIDSIIDHGVRYCTDLGLYCIIDWHTLSDYDPNMYKSEAVKFFDKMSEKYGKQGNVIFEIWHKLDTDQKLCRDNPSGHTRECSEIDRPHRHPKVVSEHRFCCNGSSYRTGEYHVHLSFLCCYA